MAAWLDLPRVVQFASHRGRNRHGGAGEMSARAGSLAANEIPVGGRNRTRTGRNAFAISSDAQASSRFAPCESGLAKSPIQPFRFAIALHLFRSGHDPGRYAGSNMTTSRKRRRFRQFGETRIRRAADAEPLDAATR